MAGSRPDPVDALLQHRRRGADRCAEELAAAIAEKYRAAQQRSDAENALESHLRDNAATQESERARALDGRAQARDLWRLEVWQQSQSAHTCTLEHYAQEARARERKVADDEHAARQELLRAQARLQAVVTYQQKVAHETRRTEELRDEELAQESHAVQRRRGRT